MEAYVFDTPSINAWATEARDHVFVGLSSAAVNKLAEGELGIKNQLIGKGELEALGNSFNSMSQQLKKENIRLKLERDILKLNIRNSG